MNVPCRRWAAAVTVVALLFAAGAARGDGPLDIPGFGGPPADAAPHGSADVAADLDATALRPGTTARVAVVVTVHAGLHAQSHAPGDPSYLPLIVTPKTTSPGVAFGDVRYPPGKDVNYPALGATLNVYLGRVTAYVPVVVAADAKPGPVRLTGVVDVQACDEKVCFPPEKLTFTVDTTVVAADAKVDPAHAELFTGPLAANPATVAPATRPATAPALAAATPSTPAKAGGTVLGLDLNHGGLPLALAAAFVVGIIFNAMPCVLPVVPLKIMGFYEVSKHNRGRCLFLGGVFSAGIVAVFAVLALLIVGLHVIDWGGLFQRTWFTVAITVVLLAMAAGTFGLFAVALPANVYALTPRHDTVGGNFLFGMLTAALSTPCTFGVFVALLTWTLRQPAPAGFAVFLMVGVGMAAPYLVLSAVPEVARHFPRTGPWGGLVKQLMGFLLLATAAFFAQPLLAHAMSVDATWWLMFAVVAAGCGFLVVRAAQLSTPRWPVVVAGVVAAAVVVPAWVVTRRFTFHPYQWRPYTPAALAAATAAGHPVVIDFTATWCGNCHWLEGTVLHDPKVVRAVSRHDVVMLQADVTYADAAGQPLLNRLNPARSIPLTAVYAPHALADGRPAVLDGIYSAADLVDTLDRVTGG